MTKLPFKVLEQQVKKARTDIVLGSKWRHYKGGDYTISDIVVTEEDNALAVIYTPIAHPDVSFTRPLAVWYETVEWEGRPVGRFTRF